MLKLEIKDNGFHFAVTHDGIICPFKDWDSADDCIYYLPLSVLADNGMAQIDNCGCLVPFESVYFLDDSEKMLLGVPPSYPYGIRLRSEGIFSDSNFRYILDFLEYIPDGNMLGAKLTGNVVSLADGAKMLLSQPQFRAISMIEQFNGVGEEFKTREYNLHEFGKIKQAALEASFQLDDYLANENVYIPEQINLELGREGDSLTIKPAVDIEDKEKFQTIFERQKKVRADYPVADESGRVTRVVFNPSQKEGLEKIKSRKCRIDSPEEIKEILDCPTEFFDPDVFDISEFYSERVIDLGFYKPKFYPFVSPYKSTWIVEARIEHPLDGTSILKFENFDHLEEFDKALRDALKAGKTIVEYNDIKLDAEDAKLLSEMAHKQLENPGKRVKVESEGNTGQRKVLIIEDNAEETKYRIGNQLLDSEKEYTLHSNRNLLEAFSLKNHQKEGVAWLQYLMEKNAPGCLMADDMGLGKTLQVLYFIDWHAQTHPMHKPYLIIAPVSLLENWENEYKRFFKDKLEITRLSSGQVPRKFDRRSIDMMQKSSIILTNYETLRSAQLNFCAVNFEIVVLDEAQKIKSPGTLVTNAVKALKSTFRIALTGTPVENTLLDLWCIMDFCVPGLLGNAKEFARVYQSPLKNEDTDLEALGNEIHDELGMYFIRRLKKDAAKDLPKKIEIKQGANMPPLQDSQYRKVIEEFTSGIQPNVLLAIQGIRTVSEHPRLYDGPLDGFTPESLIAEAARLQVSVRFIEKIREKAEKAIIFAERKEIQKMLQRIILSMYGFTAKIINGDTPTGASVYRNGRQSRQSAIDEFQNSPGFGIIIMSPLAAGMGLNVTAANHVIHYSRNWNPAKENQATDRAYRIGQEKDVYVYYPMATSPDFKSFDVTLDELLSRKVGLATATVFPTERIELKPEEFETMLDI